MDVAAGYAALQAVTTAMGSAPWWLEFGGLLGLVRDRALIPWDTDLDIGVRAEDWLATDLLPGFEAAGLERKSIERWSSPWTRHIVGPVDGLPTKVRFDAGGVRVVVHVWYAGAGLHGASRWSARRRDQVGHAPARLALAGDELAFTNGPSVPTPRHRRAYLGWFYGTDWRTPKRSWIGSALHRHQRSLWLHTPSRRVLTTGVWDLLHRGHVNRLHHAAQLGDYLVVAVQADEHVGWKVPPIRSTAERVDDVKALDVADEVIVYESGSDPALIDAVSPQVFVQGLEWPDDADRVAVVARLEALGAEILLLPRTPDVSTTDLRRRVTDAA